MKDIYSPDSADIYEWLESGTDKWPAADWDYYVISEDNDLLVLQLANDRNCAKRDFFVHCLYYLVGDYYNSGKVDSEKKDRIEGLLNRVDESSSAEVLRWKHDVEKLLSGELEFDRNYWLHNIIEARFWTPTST